MLSHNQVEEIKAQAFTGVPSTLDGVCQIRPLTMKEILTMGDFEYRTRLGLLLLTEVEIANIIKDKTKKDVEVDEIKILPYLLQSTTMDDNFLVELQTAFSTFITEDILLLPKINCILVGPPEQRRLITPDNYADFQEILRIQNQREVAEKPPENESAIARKFRLKREQRDAIKRKQQQKTGQEQSLVELLEIASVFGIDYRNETLYAFYSLIRRHQLKEKWDQDIQMLCAGADSKKLKTKYWGESSVNK